MTIIAAKSTIEDITEWLLLKRQVLEKTVELEWSLLQEMRSVITSIDETQNLLLAKLTQTIKFVSLFS